ncbi:pectinesterase [Actinoplanes sp. SE50]|uniref:pectinesterase family protein n=1 Tax=unclassified Actinoplanes TaxID=2626549 RepID=UPI00023EC682|nr:MULTISPECIES: pectinesterase family protein [unclassified Actinoplanes]AEV85908.1 pectinesterase [Actinoplanes sp. SE50/110]ATO84304.1 pectinesterase [Actinoplanes sp. SE50]SLM01714.1 pectinesterase [Actinoplanes sp. SE50/110]
MSHSRIVAGAVAVSVVLTPVAARAATSFTVAADGSGDYTTIQAAVAASSAGGVITIKAGTYQGQVQIPASKSGITLQGATGISADVIITGNKPQSTAGTAGSATVHNLAPNSTIKGLTMQNTYGAGSQALALYAAGDRQVYRNVQLKGYQDTFLSWGGTGSSQIRQYIYKSYISGAVDFLYGNGAVVIDSTTIESLNIGSSANNGYITAAATDDSNAYGFLITRSVLKSTAAPQTVALGRCWHAGGAADAIGQVLVRDSSLGSHIRQAGAWQDMGGFSWRTCRFTEYADSGAGVSTGTGDRPQLSAASAANCTARRYLAGSDGWNPVQ